MRKEILYAILAGGLFGLVIAFGIWKANSSAEPQGAQDILTPEKQVETPQNENQQNGEITLIRPKNNQVINTQKTSLAGITKPENIILISTENEDIFVEVDENGAFEQEIDLVDGLNNINLFSIGKENKTTKKDILVAYSSDFEEKSDEVNQDSENESKSGTESSIRNIVQEKVNLTRSNPLFYAGTITDISEEAIQLKEYSPDQNLEKSGEIKQVAVNNTTKYVKINKEEKEVSFSDLAIGDFIIAMGYEKNTLVLEAEKVIITTLPTFPTLSIFVASIESANNRKISATLYPNNENVELSVSKNAGIFNKDNSESDLEMEDLENENEVIIIVSKDDDGEEIRNIFLTDENTNSSSLPSPTPKDIN